MTDTDLHGKLALVTGGSRSIGAACALRLAAAGADVAVAYQQSKSKAVAVADEARRLGVRAEAFQADLGDRDQAMGLADEVAAEFGHLDVLVNSAGVFLNGLIGTLSAADVARQWRVNVDGPVALTERAVTHMRYGGRIINIGSQVYARAYMAGFGDYSATKAALAMYGRSWAHELAQRGITVNTVVPGFAETDMVIPEESDLGQQILAAIPSRRCARPEEVAAVVAFVASPQAWYMTGGEVFADGGWNA
jgi:3-oxoacyl-[acyl-carrier protein] reductase